MITVEDAQTRILASVSPLAAETVALTEGWNRALAQDLAARRTQPPFDASAMDGYAVRHVDLATLPATLKIIGQSAAGHRFGGHVGAGETVRIFTGAPVPEGADTVVLQEDTRVAGDQVMIDIAPASGDHIRPAGCDFAAGDVLLKHGTLLGARHIGLAAALNHPWLVVHRRPRIAILATGDEVALPGEPLTEDQIIGSNGPAIAALVRAAGGEPILLGTAQDTLGSLEALIASARGADMLVTIGGASVGDHDLVQSALRGAGMTLDFWKIAMRPGKPLMYGRLGDMPVLGLPGNPVSATLCALLFLKPAIRKLQGLADPLDSIETAITTTALAPNGIRQTYLRAVLSFSESDSAIRVTALRDQDSALTSVLAKADALILRPPNADAVPVGAAVSVMRLGIF